MADTIKGYVVDNSSLKTTAKKKKSGKKEILYTVEIEDGENLVIKRHGKPASYLVFIIGRNTFYTYKDGSSDMYALSVTDVVNFTRDMPSNGLAIGGTVWIDKFERGKYFAEALLKFLDEYAPYIKTKLVKFNYGDSRFGGQNAVNEYVKNMYVTNKKIFKYYLSRLMKVYNLNEDEVRRRMLEACNSGDEGAFFARKSTSNNEFAWLNYLRHLYGIDNVRKLIDRFISCNLPIGLADVDFLELMSIYYPDIRKPGNPSHRGSFYRHSDARNFIAPPEIDNLFDAAASQKNNAHMEFSSFLDYISKYEIEGYHSLEVFFRDWKDSLLGEQYCYNDKIKEKYPKNLASYHNQISRKCRVLEQILYKKYDFSTFVDIASFLEYDSKDYGSYFWIIPKNEQDLSEEAFMQQNCLKAWIPVVARGDKMLAFMRLKKEPDKSLLTIEVRNDGTIGEIAGFMNRPPNADELTNIKRWAKEVGIIYDEKINS